MKLLSKDLMLGYSVPILETTYTSYSLLLLIVIDYTIIVIVIILCLFEQLVLQQKVLQKSYFHLIQL